MPDFQKWPSIPRLFRDVTITEKIDGSNAAVGISDELLSNWESGCVLGNAVTVRLDGKSMLFYAQSRNRIITPEQDNLGFARWAYENAADLAADLGVGLHFGEWWGSGIQRGYGLPKGEKRFSLFNTRKYGELEFKTPGVATVPVLYEGVYSDRQVHDTAAYLHAHGSQASPGFDRPEGIVVFHRAADLCFKFTPYEKDDGHKG